MSESPPELLSQYRSPSINSQVTELIEIIDALQESLPPVYREHGQDASIGQARKRAIVVGILLTSLVPVSLPILSPILC